MDPLSAVGLASAILNFLDFSWSLVTSAKELHRSGRGTTRENARIGSIVGDLQDYSLELSVTGESQTRNRLPSKHEKALRDLAQSCAALSAELEDILGRLRGVKNSKWQSLRTTWASMRKKSEIASIEARLGQYRAQMNTRLLAMLRGRQSALFEALDDIKQRLESLGQVVCSTQRQARILQHVYFDDMFAREDAIEDAAGGTFGWMLEGDRGVEGEGLWEDNTSPARARPPDFMSDAMDASRRLLQTWLREGHGVFHISGKAGSGKSTLMKLVSNDQRTANMLQQWSGGRALVTASFYFWNSGSELQTSLRGLYRAILFLVLRQCPDLIPQVFHDQWENLSEPSATSQSQSLEAVLFRPQHVKAAFDVLMELPVQSGSPAFCFFIDGLDEYEAHAFDHKRLAVQLRNWAKASYIKLCVSSRPHAEFTDTFPPAQRIRLHELTAYDMHRFSCDLFESDDSFPRVRDLYLELVRDMVEMAEGVFLWARIVCKSVV
ncbi:hypothetical protein B0T26DRAFT_626372, partial [Lasiosphaeria miniovina]